MSEKINKNLMQTIATAIWNSFFRAFLYAALEAILLEESCSKFYAHLEPFTLEKRSLQDGFRHCIFCCRHSARQRAIAFVCSPHWSKAASHSFCWLTSLEQLLAHLIGAIVGSPHWSNCWLTSLEQGSEP